MEMAFSFNRHVCVADDAYSPLCRAVLALS